MEEFKLPKKDLENTPKTNDIDDNFKKILDDFIKGYKTGTQTQEKKEEGREKD